MAAASGQTLSPVTGPYFTKYSDDHWVTPAEPVQSAVMFKDKEYPSASAALEAYIKRHEGRPGLLLPAARRVEPVEELLTPYAARSDYADQIQVQRLKALKKMVDEAYERLEAKTTLRGRGDMAQVVGGGSIVNNALTESQRLLSCISPLPGTSPTSTEVSMSTNALLNARPENYTAVSSTGVKPVLNSTVKRGYKTMKDYVEEARRAGIDPATVNLSAVRPQPDVYSTDSHMPYVGSTARPTVLSASPCTRQHGGGGRSPPGWVKDLGSSQLSPPPDEGHHCHGATRHSTYPSDHRQELTPVSSYQRWNHKSKDDMYLMRDGREQGRVGMVAGKGQLDRVSLTTDDLLCATPDGRGIKLQSSLRSPPATRRYTNPAAGPPGPAAARHRSAATGEPPCKMLTSMRRDFANRLLQEVEEGPSSIITGHLCEGGAMHAYQSPLLPARPPAGGPPGAYSPAPAGGPPGAYSLAPAGGPPGAYSPTARHPAGGPSGAYSPTARHPAGIPSGAYSPPAPAGGSPGAYSPTKLRTLGLLTPETEQLLRNPPKPRAMPGYVPSPAYVSSPESADTPEHDLALAATRDLGVDPRDLSVDFTERVRALLMAPPSGEQQSCSPGAVSERTEDILDGDREWEKQPSYKPPKYVSDELSFGAVLESSKEKRANIVDSFLKECLDETDKETAHTLSGPNQHGSMEALKNMLFKVQGMVPPPADQSMNEMTQSPPNGEVENEECPDGARLSETGQDGASRKPETQETQAVASRKSLVAYKHLVADTDSFEEQQGTGSLQRAMEHLDRLKTLVKDSK